MAIVYKLWLVAEEYDDETGETIEQNPCGLPDCLGTFDTVEEMRAAGWAIVQAHGTDPETSDYDPKYNDQIAEVESNG